MAVLMAVLSISGGARRARARQKEARQVQREAARETDANHEQRPLWSTAPISQRVDRAAVKSTVPPGDHACSGRRLVGCCLFCISAEDIAKIAPS